MLTQSTQQALAILRDPSQFQWYIIPFVALFFYVYTVEVEKRNWSLVLAGLTFWGMDWINEIWNSLVLHFTNYAPVWGAPGKTAFLILSGLNIEICFMFALSGLIWCKMLLPDKKTKILGLAQSLVLRHCWIHLLRLHRSDLECSRRSHLGVSLVEPVCTLADLPDRLPALLCDGLLGFRYEDS